MPNSNKDTASTSTSTGKPEPEDDRLIYRIPDQPPVRHTVTVEEDGTFTYSPSLDAEDSSQP